MYEENYMSSVKQPEEFKWRINLSEKCMSRYYTPNKDQKVYKFHNEKLLKKKLSHEIAFRYWDLKSRVKQVKLILVMTQYPTDPCICIVYLAHCKDKCKYEI